METTNKKVFYENEIMHAYMDYYNAMSLHRIHNYTAV